DGQASVTTVYSGLSTTVINPKGQRKTSKTTAQGQLAEVTDEQGNTVTYRHDALGQLIETDAAGLVTRLRYDLRGRKVAMQDPAMGEWQYAYNAHGELVWQRDALGQAITQDYDALGRLVQRTEPDLTSRWSYDRRFDRTACGKSIGKLCEATADNGYRRLHRYDSLGRPQSTSTVLDNPAQPAVISVTYDEATGRIASQRWPTGLEARYEYTEGGFLWRVTGSQPPKAGTTAPAAAPVSYEVLAMDAQGRITRFRQGNLVTVRAFDAATGRLRNQQAGTVLNHAYGYDGLGNLTSRTDTSPGVGTRESFAYDSLNRLGLYTVMGGSLARPQATEVLYDARGNIRYKSDVGSYWYDPARPTRLAHITLDTAPAASLALTGTRALSYAFDDNGNLLYTVGQDLPHARHTHRRESYTSFNKPREFSYSEFPVEGAPASAAAADRLSFVYGPEHQRIRQQVRIAGNAPSALSSGSTWYLHGEGEQALSYEKEVKDSGLTEHRHYLQAGGMVFAMVVTRTGALAGQKPIATRYFHHDHLGSIAAMTDEGGQLVERLAYDPWGKRRHVDGMPDASDSIIGWATERGYTMHEHLDEIGVIHMNGRVYDPLIGRFMSADPFIQSPRDLQSHNRYAYVLNNPLAYTDPSGYFSWRRVLRTVAAIAVAVNFGPAVIGNMVGAGQLFTAASFGGSAAAAGVANAAVAGFMSGAISSGSFKGALHGALTGALFFGVGEFVPGGAGSVSKVLGHAAAGCISAAAGGGRCGDGAVAAGTAQLGGSGAGDLGDLRDMAADAFKTAVLGAVGAMVRGGRFDEGLMTGALDYLFNALAHPSQRDRRFYSAAAGVVESVGWENPENHRQGYGFRVKVRTVSDASLFLYAHVEPDSIMVYEGLVVLRGEYLGRYAQPANGSATGPHLHFEWWSKARERLDPAALLSVVMPSAVVRDTIRFRNVHPVSGRARWHNGYDLVGPLTR
ncbi:MAG: RHS repeat-associated core domain-containing protein, partial [Pseudomonadota bacterium]